MKWVVCSLLSVLFYGSSFAQVKAYALATADIIDPVAVIGLPQATDPVSLSGLTSFPKGGTKAAYNSHSTLKMAKFKIMGAGNNGFSLLLEAESVRLENRQSRAFLLVTELQVATTPEATQFVLQGKPFVPRPLISGHYANTTPVEITAFFD